MTRHPTQPCSCVRVITLLSVMATFRLMVTASASAPADSSLNPTAQSWRTFSGVIPATTTSPSGVPSVNGSELTAALQCLLHEFECEGEKCIDGLKVCDTQLDCAHGQDEEPQRCRTHPCPRNHFKCLDGYCIPFSRLCDYTPDCPDHSDERGCNYRKCYHGEWRCQNQQCINEVFICDGVYDCKDKSDEIFCTSEDFLICDEGKRVHNFSKCNEIVDCIDQADESDCGLCRQDQFQCHNGRCISAAHVCDSVCDCPQSTCEDEARNCQPFYDGLPGLGLCRKGSAIACDRTNRCIHSRYICDGTDDCLNSDTGEDEFKCSAKKQTHSGIHCSDGRMLPFHTVCDYRRHCLEGEDEADCDYPECLPTQAVCQSGECVSADALCDGQKDCLDGSDEVGCLNFTCPPETFKCTHSGHCLPISKVCDHRVDCLTDGSDEPETCAYKMAIGCDEGQFRCANGQCISDEYVCRVSRDSALYGCVDASHLTNCSLSQCGAPSWLKCRNGPCYHKSLQCNGRPDCLIGSRTWTDEETCPFQCSKEKKCVCVDVSMECLDLGLPALPHGVQVSITKFFLSGNRLHESLNATTFHSLHRLTVLDLSRNGIRCLPLGRPFKELYQLRILMLADNEMEIIPENAFYGLANLRVLDLSRNRIQNITEFSFNGLSSLPQLDLSHQNITVVPAMSFIGLRNLLSLNLSGNPLRVLGPDALFGLTSLVTLDISNTDIPWGQQKYSPNSLDSLISLTTLYTSDARFCCSLGARVSSCFPKLDHFSSCADLMSNLVLRCAIWIMGTVALIANAVVIYWRLPDLSRSRIHAFLIINLAIGDIVMGVYLLIIAFADLNYRGTYVSHLHEWKSSVWCEVAGFFSTVSSELSILTLLVITLDRLLTILLPFHIGCRLTYTSARFMMLGIWIFVFLIAIAPFLPIRYFDNFYGRSGVCLALHITPHRFPGWEYSVFIFLALNLLACMLIILSYCAMYVVALKTGKAVQPSPQKNRKESRLARRMIVIILTNLGCYLPISIMSLLALSEFSIPEEVYAWVAVFMLPVNSALNPLLYTISTRPFRRHLTSSIANRAQHLRDSLLASISSSSRRRTSSSAHSTQLALPKTDRNPKCEQHPEHLPEEL